jgi:hypothetical protein
LSQLYRYLKLTWKSWNWFECAVGGVQFFSMICLFGSSTCFEKLCAHPQDEISMITPEIVFIQLSSWGWTHSCSKHVEDSNKRIIVKLCVTLVTYQNWLKCLGNVQMASIDVTDFDRRASTGTS